MIRNIMTASVVQLGLAALVYVAAGNHAGGGSLMAEMLGMLFPWLAGLACILAGYWMRPSASAGRCFLSVAVLPLAGVLLALAAVFLPENMAVPVASFSSFLALPFQALLAGLTVPVLAAAVPFCSSLLMFSGMQIRQGKQGKRGLALGLVIAYLMLLLLVPVVMVVRDML